MTQKTVHFAANLKASVRLNTDGTVEVVYDDANGSPTTTTP